MHSVAGGAARAVAAVALAACVAGCGDGPDADSAVGCVEGPFLAVDRGVNGLAEIMLYGGGAPHVLVRNTVTTEPTFSPDGSQLAYVKASGDYESAGPDSTEIWTVDVDGDDARQLVPAPPMVTSPDWSPTGESIAYVGYVDGFFELRQVDTNSGDTATILRLDGFDIRGPDWSPDGTQLAFITSEYDSTTSSSTMRVATVDADGSGYRPVAEVAEARWLSWGPDGQSVLVSTLAAEDGAILRLNLDDGSITELASSATMAEWGPNGEIFYLELSETPALWHVVRGRFQEDSIVRTGVIDDEPIYGYPYFGMDARHCVP